MDILFLISILVALCALFSYINIRFFKLQPSIGLMLISLIFSLLIIAESKISSSFYQHVENMVRSIDFSQTLLNIMLGFLLFAGSLHINLQELKKQKAAVLSFSTLSVAISIIFFGSIMWFVFNFFNHPVDFIYCLLFGALVSPTDPIAVIGILRKSNMPKEIEATINGESLFNDGIGVVFFVTISSVISLGVENLSAFDVLILFGREVFGGVILGLTLGYGVYYFIKKIDHYQTEVLISLALVMICGELAQAIHVSGPLAVIVIGLILGNKVSKTAMSDTTRDYHNKFWELLDDFLNSILFVLIGLQMVLLPFIINYVLIGLLAIILLLICRYISLSVPIYFLKDKKLFNNRTALVMTWGGLRGGLSIALTLSLPDNRFKEIMVAITYIIVIFSILVQGLTTEKLVKRIYWF
ncbi:MAG TPA: sodium:proton antiporter [Bacteroidia bacterium]|nr:sodium:proton antiporter [Bacteroidia bacterium]